MAKISVRRIITELTGFHGGVGRKDYAGLLILVITVRCYWAVFFYGVTAKIVEQAAFWGGG